MGKAFLYDMKSTPIIFRVKNWKWEKPYRGRITKGTSSALMGEDLTHCHHAILSTLTEEGEMTFEYPSRNKKKRGEGREFADSELRKLVMVTF